MTMDRKRIWTRAAGLVAAAAMCVGGGWAASTATAAGASDGTTDEGFPTVPAPVLTTVTTANGTDCAAVATWAALADCVGNAQGDGLVTITGTVNDVPADAATVTVSRNIALTATTGEKASLTGTTAGGRLFDVAAGATLHIGKDAQDGGFSYRNGARGFAHVATGGSFVVNGGEFDGNKAVRGAVVYGSDKAKVALAVHGGTFTGNVTSFAAGVFMQSGAQSVTVIDGGTFGIAADGTADGNVAGSQGGVIHNNGKLTIKAGTFSNNTAKVAATMQGGGVVSQDQGSTTIEGGTFTGNSAIATPDRTADAGGGALYAEGGEVSITGGTFDGNHTNARAYGSGGGALYVHGKLNVANAADGTKPTFTNNWASEDTADPVAFNGGKATGSIKAGGAGGAIFLQGYWDDAKKSTTSYGYFLGGEFSGNVSGYLGGAIYTEEYTVSYVGPAAATQNTAGHFGGGLWFCPSGVSEASKSGNIALKENSVSSAIDGNTDNATSTDAPTEAGSDLAIMSPYYKRSHVQENAFQLLDTWFTDRGTKTVDWYWDGQPRTTASGYADEWQAGSGGQGKDAVRAYKTDGSDQYDDEDNPSLTDGKYKRYTTADASTKQDSPTTIQQYWNKSGQQNTYGGIGLKAVLNAEGQAKWQSAWQSAKVTFQHNGARLSGGAFGSNGRVILSTPYSAAWNKVDDSTDHKALKGSSWRVSAATGKKNDDGKYTYTNAAPVNNDRLGYDASCPTMDKRDEKNTSQNGCWMHRKGDADGVVSIIVTDNDARDNNPDDGAFSIDNLKPDMTYELTEETAPAGYAKSDAVYSFTTSATQTVAPKIEIKTNSTANDAAVVDDDHDGVARGIVNKPLPGLHWNKVDADTNALLGGSTWTITKTDDPTWSKDIVDCETDGCTAKSGDLLDVDTAKGQFEVKNTDLPAGTYTLKEKTAPEGYWLNGATYTFRVVDGSTEQIKLTKQDEQTPLNVNQVEDEAMGVAWTKTDGDGTALAGSEWTITDKDGKVVKTVKDCVSSSCAADGNDTDKAKGGFTVTGLTAGSYTLTETKAPEGYQLPANVSYTFIIEQGAHTIANVKVNGTGVDGKQVSDNHIVNLQQLSALPFTGGRSALDWLIIGGGLALAAAAVAMAARKARRGGLYGLR
ncbi:hypothetical protein JS531_10485 [Bifidobacterium sp. CP2]|uniref:SpaA isopeptide-forming pilin-related protein n=1 Tax=Bifidobacterium sp. CP2 TaxID=2809025 RepID=UPI001BDD0587|nr:SpaA isopeptide-forming pilin-related protein [Bifidobacterium sp. CP2]MBT1182362.1 hypothetical protein [Bifidobacterium sp. CP2]